MQAGEFITCKAAYGYKLKDGALEISEPEASVVRNIFSLYLSGSGLDQIADLLAKSGIPTGYGKTVWNRAAVAYIIHNEKYIGDSMLQKKYSTGQIPYTQKINKGERIRYYLQNTHPPIIDQNTFQQANVVADCISFATTFLFKKSSLIHFVAPPLQTEPAALGFGLVLGKPFGWVYLYCLTITYERSPFFEQSFRKTDFSFLESLTASD